MAFKRLASLFYATPYWKHVNIGMRLIGGCKLSKARIPRHRHRHPREDPRRHVRHARFPEVIPVASLTTRRHSRDDPREGISVSWNAGFNSRHQSESTRHAFRRFIRRSTTIIVERSYRKIPMMLAVTQSPYPSTSCPQNQDPCYFCYFCFLFRL